MAKGTDWDTDHMDTLFHYDDWVMDNIIYSSPPLAYNNLSLFPDEDFRLFSSYIKEYKTPNWPLSLYEQCCI